MGESFSATFIRIAHWEMWPQNLSFLYKDLIVYFFAGQKRYFCDSNFSYCYDGKFYHLKKLKNPVSEIGKDVSGFTGAIG